MSDVNLTGIQAHYLLFALDYYCATDKYGKITLAPYGSFEKFQELRDKLFAAHEHPSEDFEE